MKKEKRNQIIWIIVMSIASLIMLVPIIMMFMTSFKTMAELQGRYGDRKLAGVF